ncbi:MAG: glycosyltransferase family 4 protein [bacterium]|nr:glycosyltransferase family 4 protein [bacterium]
MRLLLVTTYFEPDSGAAAVRLSRLARMLSERGHDVTVLTAMPHYPGGKISPAYRGTWTTQETRDGVRIVRTWLLATPSPRMSRKFVSQISFMLTSALRGTALDRPDVMLVEAQPVFTSAAGVFLSMYQHVPYVLNVSDLWPDHLLTVGALTETHPVYRVARALVDQSYRSAAAITTLSPVWSRVIESYIGEENAAKIHTIFNGVDLTRFRPDVETRAFRTKYNLPDKKLVTFIGTFATQYDLETMLAAADRLRRRDDVVVAFIGAGSQGGTLRQRLQNGEYPNVRLIDWLDHTEIPAAWCASHLTMYALRSQALYQGTVPAKLFEAFACGVPMVAAAEGTAPDIIAQSGSGLTTTWGDVDGFTAAIERLLDDDDLRQSCSRAGRAYAEAHFDPLRVTDAYEQVLLGAVRKDAQG